MRLFIFITLCSLLQSGCSKVDERTKMRQSDELTTTHCIGRHNIALPDSYLPSKTVAGLFKYPEFADVGPSLEMTVTAAKMTAQGFKVEVARRRKELESGETDGVNVLRDEQALSDTAHLFRVHVINNAYVSEIIVLQGTSLVSARLESFRNTFLDAEESLKKFAAEIVDISNGTPSGFCVGSVGLIGRYKTESASFSFRDQTGTRFDFDIDTYTPDAAVPFLQRIEGPGSLLRSLSLNHGVLRSGERTVAGMRAQEWLGWAKLSEDGDNKSLKFMAETMRSVPGKESPRIKVTFVTSQALDNGTPTVTSISENEAVTLWDRVVSSIKLR